MDQPLRVQFSGAVNPLSATRNTLTLLGPQGPIEAEITLSERNTVAMLKPGVDLLPGSAYTLYINGVRTEKNDRYPVATISFTTARLGRPAAENAAAQSDTIGKWPILRLTTGAISSAPASGAAGGRAAAGLPATSKLVDGSWQPGLDSRDGRWRINQPLPPIAAFETLNRAVKPDATLLYGQVLRLDDRPVAGVEVSIGDHLVRTDEQGRFLLTELPAGKQELFVDGSTVEHGTDTYGQVLLSVEIQSRHLNRLPQQVFLPKLSARDRVVIDSPTKRDIVITHPDLPGFELQIPKDTVIRDRRGRIVTTLSIIPTPLDRAPYPIPENFPVYFNLQPGGAAIIGLTPEAAKGVRVVYPNYTRAAANSEQDFWFYDASEGWRVYGKGHVSPDGQHVVPDAGVALFAQMSAGYNVSSTPPPSKNPPPGCNRCDGGAGAGGVANEGEPIDLRTGTFQHRWVDIAIDDIVPLQLERNYINEDSVSRPFGYGMNHIYGMYLYNPTPDYATPQLVLSDGSVIRFTRVSGSGATGSWIHTASRTEFYGATLTLGGALSAYYVTLKDGTQYSFNNHAPSNLTSIRDRYGNTTNLTYTSGRLTQIRSPSGRYFNLSYDSSNRITQLQDSGGRIIGYTYNGQGTLDTTTYPDGSTEHYTYDASRRMLTYTDRRGNLFLSNVYDAQGRVTQQTLADGAKYQFAYTTDANGVVTKTDATDPRGTVRRVVFDPISGYPITDTIGYGTSLAQTYTFERNAAGLITARIDPLGRRTEYAFDGKGNATQIKLLAGTPNAVVYQYSYTADYSQIASITDPLNHTTRFSYASGCLTQVTDVLNRVTQLTCNGSGQRTSITDALGRTTRFNYDGYDLYAITDPLNRTATFYRDNLGRVIATQNALGHRTLTQYDALDRATQTTDAVGATTQYTYDANGNLTVIRNPIGSPIDYSYDVRDRVTLRTDPLRFVERWTYDLNGNILSSTDRKGQSTQFNYDALGRQTRVTYADGSAIDVQYDAGNRATQFNDSVSGLISRNFDGLDRLVQETSPQGAVTYGYDKASRRTSFTASGQASVTYGYDDADRLKAITQGSEITSFLYDAVDRRTQLTLPNGIKTNYGYDAADQITALSYLKADGSPIGDLGYTYDSAGRRTKVTGSFAPQKLPNPTTSDYQYNANNQLVGGNGKAPQYDANGDPTSDGLGTQYTFDARHRLIQISQGVVIVASFQYDAFGRRIGRTDASGVTTAYLYDGSDAVQEVSGGSTRTSLVGQNIDERFARDDVTGRTYFLTDALGSTIALTDAAANIKQRYDYSPYGEANLTGAAGLTNPYQYTGRENDGSGLYYYRARYYSPVAKRFISEDPTKELAGIDAYVYVRGNPISRTDPLGLFYFSPPGSGIPDDSSGPFADQSEQQDFSNCSYYSSECQKTGLFYYCVTGRFVCNSAQNLPNFWRVPARKLNCIRTCLVRSDAVERSCTLGDHLSSNQIDAYHEICFPQCGVDPQVYPGVTPLGINLNPDFRFRSGR